MTGKQAVLRLLVKMPEEATLSHIVRWVNLLDLIGAAKSEADEFDADFESDLNDFFVRESRKKRKAVRIKSLEIFGNQSPRQMCISIVKNYPDELSIYEILCRLTVVKKIDEALADGELGAMEHEAFFRQLEKQDEESDKARLEKPRAKRPVATAKVDRKGRPANGAKVRSPVKGRGASA